MKTQALLISALIANVAYAAPSVTVASNGTDVIVTIEHAKPAGELAANGDRLVLPIASGSTIGRADFTDETVKRVEIANQRITIGLHHSKKSTELTAQKARVSFDAGADEIVIRLPRSPKGAVEMPAEKPAVAAAPVVEKTPIALGSMAKIEAPKPAPPEPKTDAAKAEIAVAAIAVATPPEAPAAIGAPENASTTPSLARMFAFVGLIACGGIALFTTARKKARDKAGDKDPIRVIASRPLHGKARLVLVEAKGRELLVAVHEGRTDLLGGWSTHDGDGDSDDGPMLSAAAIMNMANEVAAPPAPIMNKPANDAPKHSSPAVAGILKLRQKAEASTTTHPDAEWARELALATANKRSAS